MGSVALGLSQEIKWPNFCAICNEQATDWAKTSITSTSQLRYYVVALTWSKQKYSLAYPVCKKHKNFSNFLNLPSEGSTFDILFWGLISTLFLAAILAFLFFIIFALLGLKTVSHETVGGISALWLVGCYILYSAFYQPVQILSLSEDSITISIKNENYFNEFKLLNISNVLNR